MIYNGTVNECECEWGCECNSCTRYTVLFVIFSILSTIISNVFIYFHWYLKRSNTNIINNINANTEAEIY